jgi:sulfonate transport system ATP-binding protein
VREPELLLLDEPFAALDALTRLKMHALVERLIALHRPATLLVTHDVDEAIQLADRVAVMSHGVIVEDVTVGLARPRLRGTPGFDELRTLLLGHLGVVLEPPAGEEASGV